MTSQTSTPAKPVSAHPYRQIRASYDDETITVYQAYSEAIATAAVKEQRLDASPDWIKSSQKTWIKPSWCWMMYRSGYAQKDARQTHILALKIKHSNLLHLLSLAITINAHAPNTSTSTPSPSNPQPQPNKTDFHKNPVTVQWDPERSPEIGKLNYRSIQIGVSSSLLAGDGDAGGRKYIESIEDVTERARALGEFLRRDGGEDKVKKKTKWSLKELVERGLVPNERVWDVADEDVRHRLGMEVPGDCGAEQSGVA